MQTKTLNSEEAVDKRAAALDVAYRNARNSGNFSNAHKDIAETLKTALYTLYNTTGVYINYRQNFIAIKVATPATVTDHALLAAKEAQWEAIGFVKAKTAQGIIYRLPL